MEDHHNICISLVFPQMTRRGVDADYEAGSTKPTAAAASSMAHERLWPAQYGFPFPPPSLLIQRVTLHLTSFMLRVKEPVCPVGRAPEQEYVR